MDEPRQIGELTPWQDLGPTPRLPSSRQPTPPSPQVVKLCSELGLRYPPANAVDRDAHTARVGLLAKDIANHDPRHIATAITEWVRSSPFFPKACEMIELINLARRREDRARNVRALPAPVQAPPAPPPLTDDELRRTPRYIVRMGLQHGWIDPEQIARVGIRTDDEATAA